MAKFHKIMGCFVPPSTTRKNLQQLRSLELVELRAALPFSSSLIATETVESIQTFEPQADNAALSAFLIIAIVFSLLQFRINSVRGASERRSKALEDLRQVKSAQLDGEETSKRPTESQVNEAISAYRSALEEELSLRTIIPGVRIVAPNDPKRTEADVAAAKQFLGLDLDADELIVPSEGQGKGEGEGKDVSIDKKQQREANSSDISRESKDDLLLQSRRRFDGKSENKVSKEAEGDDGISNGGKAVLLAIAITQIALLVFLSFDPLARH